MTCTLSFLKYQAMLIKIQLSSQEAVKIAVQYKLYTLLLYITEISKSGSEFKTSTEKYFIFYELVETFLVGGVNKFM